MVAGISFGRPHPDHPVNSFRTTRERPANAVTWHTGSATDVTAQT